MTPASRASCVSSVLSRNASLLFGSALKNSDSHAVMRLPSDLFAVALPRAFSTSARLCSESYKLLIVGGGSGGLATANKFASKLGDKKVAVIEPSHLHYYQPYFTLVGGGVKRLGPGGSHREISDILDKRVAWIRDRAVSFDPDNSKVVTHDGKEISYDFLVVSMGISTNYGDIKGLLDALETPGVCSNYHPKHVGKTFKAIQNFKEGNAIFTFPNTPVKCAGAPQKIMYLTDWRFRQMGKRDKAKLIYNTSLPVIFGVPKYAQSLMEVVKERDIVLNTRHNLIEVKPDTKEAVFQLLDSPSNETVTFKYEMLHVCPPQASPEALKKSKLADPANGFLNVDKHSLQHVVYKNVFGIGDCTNVPTAKTAAAVASQSGLLRKNLTKAMKGDENLLKTYDGYTSCPLVIGYNKCILAEFDFYGNPLETFPVDQGIPRTSMYMLKAHMMPSIYWEGLVKGYWEGPSFFRNTMTALGLKSNPVTRTG